VIFRARPRRRQSLYLVTAALLAMAGLACKAQPPKLTHSFSETFDRADLGPGWNDTGGGYQIQDGHLRIKGAYNHPLWLRQALPHDVKVEFDATSHSGSGDIKFELFGDGVTFDPDRGGYLASGYVLIFGGWGNSLSVICRENEHNEGVKAKRDDTRVEPGKTYHFSVSRKGGTLDWKIDGQHFLSWTDPSPFYGPENAYFGFNNWDADVHYDNLHISPL